jgi:hypothetical protein
VATACYHGLVVSFPSLNKGETMKKTWIVSLLVLMALVVTVNAFAADGDTTAWQGFWNSVGGFVHNALPWNWSIWNRA